MTEYLQVGDTIHAKNDASDVWGVVSVIGTDSCVAVYGSGRNTQEYDVAYHLIDGRNNAPWSGSVMEDLADGNVPKPPPIPKPLPAQPVSAMTPPSGTVDKDAQKRIWPGHIVTWTGQGRPRKIDPNRLYVILNFTKNSGRQKVNIAPLNGWQPSESLSWDYCAVGIDHISPVAFNAPLVKVTRSN